MSRPDVGVGIVGTGKIFPAYARGLAWLGLPVVRVADVDADRVAAQAREHGVGAWGTPEELCADPAVDVVVNITPPVVHAGVTAAALAAGKHVYSEKPLAATTALAAENLAQARAAGLVLGAAPDTFLGRSGQTARAALDDGTIGTPFAATCFVRSSRVETWHPDPRAFYGPGGGPVLDLGPYYATALVNLLGPVAQVSALTATPTPHIAVTAPGAVVDHVDVTVPTTAAALMRTAGGASITALYSFDVWDTELPFCEVYGTEGTLSLPDPNHHDLPVRVRRRGESAWRELEPVIPPSTDGLGGAFRGHGVVDLVESLGGAPHRTSAALALHVLEVLEAVQSAEPGAAPTRLTTTCERPAPVGREGWRGAPADEREAAR